MDYSLGRLQDESIERKITNFLGLQKKIKSSHNEKEN